MSVKHAKVNLIPDKGPVSRVQPSDWNADHIVDFSAFGIPSPLSFPDCQLWLDASQIAGLADGDPVVSWNDLSGNAYHAAQATASKQPTYKTSIVNSLSVVRFTEAVAPQYLELSGAALGLFRNIAGFTVAGVYANITLNHEWVFTASDSTSTAIRRAAILGRNIVGFIASRTDGAEKDVAEVTVSDPTLTGVIVGAVAFIAAVDFVGRNILVGASARYTSDAAGSDSLFTDTAGLTPDTASLAILVGGTSGGANGLTGDIAELIVYDRVLNLRERRLLLEYLSEKWGTL
jgi:hypothetical protein